MTQNKPNLLHAAAGIMADAEIEQSMRDMQDRMAKTIGQAIARNRDAALVACCPDEAIGHDGLEMHRIKGNKYRDGSEVYTFDGVPFVKIMPVQFVNDFKNPPTNIACSYTIKATFRFEKLEPEA